MGAATARMFAREGAKVVIADVLEHEARQVADAIGASARFEPLDVTNEESWAAVVTATTRHFGKLDVLVNNAGISGSPEQDFYSTEAWHRIMAVNVSTGVLTGRGADIILIDDPLKPEEALSETQRQAANDWFDHTLYSRQNDKRRAWRRGGFPLPRRRCRRRADRRDRSGDRFFRLAGLPIRRVVGFHSRARPRRRCCRRAPERATLSAPDH
jgi:NAD(P)-dependent dehydrogenase (short-subunit alcohol dehydrogenase family)